MAYVRHWRVTYSGVFGTAADPVEDWSMGVGWVEDGPTFLTLSDLPTIVQDLAAQWATLVPHLNSVCRMTNVRMANIDTDGKYVRDANGAMIYADHPDDRPGTAVGALALPLQVSLAVGMRSALDKPWGRGRFFLPTPQVGALEADGRISPTVAGTITNAARDFLAGVDTTISTRAAGKIVVASQGSIANGVAAANRPITEVRVGRRLDTQRRRAAKLVDSDGGSVAVAY